jgi:hypothetical protein
MRQTGTVAVAVTVVAAGGLALGLVFGLGLGVGACSKREATGEKGAGKAGATGSTDPRLTGARPGARRAGHESRRPRRRCQPQPPEPVVPDPEGTPNVKERLPKWTRTLSVRKKLKVYREPSTEAEHEGEIKKYSRLPLRAYVKGRDGCRSYWMRVAPRGWVCGDHLKPDRRATLMRTQPIMDKGDMLPGRYAWVRKGGANKYPNREAALADKPHGTIQGGFILRWKKNVSLGGKLYWQISTNYLVPADKLLRHRPSEYAGADLRELDFMVPIAIVRAKTKGAAVFDKAGGSEIDRVEHHSIHEIFESTRVGRTKYYRIGKGRWILARRVISAWPTKPPPGIKPCEKWIDIVIEHQSLVAWEGNEPVYATMLSSGDKKHPTKYGIFRLWWKKAETDMTSSMAGSEAYRVDDVPWAQFFYLGQALHGAYWHSEWGNRRSHGCVNLSPKDAKWLYDWTAPHVPDGWTSRFADEKHPGTIVRVRHKVDHEVPFLRYSRKLAPPEAVERLDNAYKERMRKKTLRMLERQGK